MRKPAKMVLVKFKTALSHDEVMQVVEERIGDFRRLTGLQQKYYVRENATGEYGGLYLWESGEALAAYSDSDLRKSIARAYRTIGEPRIEVFDVVQLLRD